MLFQILLECFFLFTSTDNENIFQTNKFPPFLLTDWEVENIHTVFILCPLIESIRFLIVLVFMTIVDKYLSWIPPLPKSQKRIL
jgi:hypothetical protein